MASRTLNKQNNCCALERLVTGVHGAQHYTKRLLSSRYGRPLQMLQQCEGSEIALERLVALLKSHVHGGDLRWEPFVVILPMPYSHTFSPQS